MPDALVAIVPALLAGVLLLSGLGKLGARDPLTAWRDLGVPDILRRPWLATAHPYVELVLATGLVLTGGLVHVVACALVVALTLAYVALVAAALRRPEPVECSCFGARRSVPVTRATLWRNVWLVLLSVTGLAVSFVDDRSALTAASDERAWWWVAGTAAAVVTTVLVVRSGAATVHPVEPGGAGGAGGAGGSGDADDPDDGLDYLRTRTPDVPVTLADGTTTTLRELSSERALLLLEVSESCGGCVEVIRSIPTWREELPEIDVRVLVTASPEASALTSTAEPQSLHDSPFHVSRSFGYGMTPTAVLLGADGLLAGGPVVGDAAIRELVAEIDAELHAASDESSPVHANEAG